MVNLTRRQFLKYTLGATGLATLGGGAGLAYGRYVEAYDYAVTYHTLKISGLGDALNGYTLVQISDIHADIRHMATEQLAPAIDLVNAQKADAVVITGDFISRQPTDDEAQTLVNQLKRVQAIDGVWAVMGNHDHWFGVDYVRALLRQTPIQELQNNVVRLEREAAAIYLAGVDDYWERKNDLSAVIDALDTATPALLLAHEPDFADISSATGRFAAQFSGHSHGGQIAAPWIGPPILPKYGTRYPSGAYQVGTMFQYTNRGLGMIEPAVRINCRPEISVFRLASG